MPDEDARKLLRLPGVLTDPCGKTCRTCAHWHRRIKEPNWVVSNDCPCYECQHYGYCLENDLMFWTPHTKGA